MFINYSTKQIVLFYVDTSSHRKRGISSWFGFIITFFFIIIKNKIIEKLRSNLVLNDGKWHLLHVLSSFNPIKYGSLLIEVQ